MSQLDPLAATPDTNASTGAAEHRTSGAPIALPTSERHVPVPAEVEEITQAPRTDRNSVTPSGLEDTPGSTALAAFIRFHPFMAFFCWLADAQFPAHQLAEVRVSKHRDNSPKLYWICVSLDMLVTLTAVVGVIALAATVAYKAVWT